MTRIYLMPLACTILTIAGLILALTGHGGASDGRTEAIGVIAVTVPILMLGWKLR